MKKINLLVLLSYTGYTQSADHKANAPIKHTVPSLQQLVARKAWQLVNEQALINPKESLQESLPTILIAVLEKFKDPKYKYTKLLHLAAENGDLEFAKVLIAAEVDIDAQNGYQNTPLYLAARNGHLQIAQVLIEAGADIDAQNSYQNTPLHIAAKNGHLLIAQDLITRGANINVQNKQCETPLHLAIEDKHLDITKFLIEAGADINTKNFWGNTPLHLAVRCADEATVKVLIGKGATINPKNYEEETPLDIANSLSYPGITRILELNSGISENPDEFCCIS